MSAELSTTIAAASRAIDDLGRTAVLQRENDALRRESHKLRSEKANLLACLEAERAEVARLRRENQSLAIERDTAKSATCVKELAP